MYACICVALTGSADLSRATRTSTMSGCVIGEAECYLSALYSARFGPMDRRVFSPGGFVHARIDGDRVSSGPGGECESSDYGAEGWGHSSRFQPSGL